MTKPQIQNIFIRRRKTITIGDFFSGLVIAILVIAIVALGAIAVVAIREDVLDMAVTEGTVVDMGYRKPYTTYMMVNKVLIPQRHSGYWWIDVYNDEIGRTRRLKFNGPPVYQIGDYWREAKD